MACEVQKGDAITVTLTLIDCDTSVPLDVSTATAQEIVLRGTGVRVAKTSSFVTDGTDGQITAQLATDELSVSGRWQVQGNVTLPGSLTYHSEVKTFQVNDNI